MFFEFILQSYTANSTRCKTIHIQVKDITLIIVIVWYLLNYHTIILILHKTLRGNKSIRASLLFVGITLLKNKVVSSIEMTSNDNNIGSQLITSYE